MPRIVEIRGNKAMPSAARIASNAIGAAGRVVFAVASGHSVHVPADVREMRETICKACPKFRAQDNRCTQCGCSLGGLILDKLRYATERCPLNKWERWSGKV